MPSLDANPQKTLAAAVGAVLRLSSIPGVYFGGCELSLLFFLSGCPDSVVGGLFGAVFDPAGRVTTVPLRGGRYSAPF